MSWQDGRRAWERLSGWYRPHPEASNGDPITDANREFATASATSALEDLRLVRGLLDQATLNAVRRARACGTSWGEISTMLGMAKEEARERYSDEAPG